MSRIYFGALAVLLLQAGSVSACPRFDPVYNVSTSYPVAEAPSVPINAPILLRLSENAQTQGSPQAGYWEPTVTLVDAEGSSTPLNMTRFGSDPDKLRAFVPIESLKPNTHYQYSVSDASAGRGGAEPLVTDFTTGDGARPPLQMLGALSATLELGTRPHYECTLVGPTTCGNAQTCVESGTDNVVLARLRLPAVVGGFSDELLDAELGLAEDNGSHDAQTFQTWHLGAITAGKAEEHLQELPIRIPGQTYIPCVTYTLHDARQDVVQSTWCSDEPFDLPPSAAPQPEAMASPTGPHTTQACAVVAPGFSNRSSCFPLLALLVALRRRSRSRTFTLLSRTKFPAQGRMRYTWRESRL